VAHPLSASPSDNVHPTSVHAANVAEQPIHRGSKKLPFDTFSATLNPQKEASR
jgi:hypothetical protein